MALLRFILLAVPFLAWLGYRFIRKKRFEQYKNIPRLPPNLIWGHLKALNEFIQSEGLGKHTDYAFAAISRALNRPSIFLLDMRPLFYPLLVIQSHTVAEQIVKPSKEFKYSVLKSPTLRGLLPIIGPTSIISAAGADWKHLRKRFNPGFAHAHLITLIPAIIGATRKFLGRLERHAKDGGEFGFDELCTALTFDIIGAVVLDVDFKSQGAPENQHPVVRLYRQLTHAYDDNTPFPFLAWRKKRKQRKYGEAVDAAIKDVVAEKFEQTKTKFDEKRVLSGRSVLELSLQDVDVLTKDELQMAADQVKSFLFAGHDTTSILLQWAFYALSIHPRVRSTLCAELDTVFGSSSSPDSVAEQLLQRGEEALSQLSYTSAVIKEILRLYPPAGSARMAPKGSGYTIRMDNGENVCVDGFVLYVNHYIIQRDPAIYGDTADDFCPERWLGDTDTSMESEYGITETVSSEKKVDVAEDGKEIPPSAWRPFERGPRNCIGQELANIEARVILACVARRFEFTKVGAGEVVLGKDGQPQLDPKGRFVVRGEMYNKRQVTSKPFDGMMMKVKVVES
ncbi:cytochrome P450 monooxygenase [Tothia fuscella]|uniref:Cytochrome P450 monooxygenase n=1 Tax=Tothia fuscella TaxID=1048955 RepID=A0A9P4NJ14_9PEZI|nr:cytochrome P450 monooxygenase [Tothia fuscella]